MPEFHAHFRRIYNYFRAYYFRFSAFTSRAIDASRPVTLAEPTYDSASWPLIDAFILPRADSYRYLTEFAARWPIFEADLFSCLI